jgi:acyl-CoA reductase-like NAD-dependent aldehyde dehydrogenase
MLARAACPLGGFKYSGVGREFGTFRVEAFLERRSSLSQP